VKVWPGGKVVFTSLQVVETQESESREMSPRAAYIEKLRRIASREKGMRRAFLFAKAHEAEAESDEQFCKRMRVNVLPGAAGVTSTGRSPSNGNSPGSPEVQPALSNGAGSAHSALAGAHSALDADGHEGRGDAPLVARPPLESGEPDQR
jgi:hypothetical protein